MLVLNPHVEYRFLEFSVYLSRHFLDTATEAGKIRLFICVKICYLCAMTWGHSPKSIKTANGINSDWVSA